MIWVSGVTGEIHHVDAGYNVVGMPYLTTGVIFDKNIMNITLDSFSDKSLSIR